MRKGICLAALVLGWLGAAPAWAQNPVAGPRPGGFSFANLFRPTPTPAFPSVRGQSNLPPPSSFPSYPNFRLTPFKPINKYKANYVYTNN